jgi:hypothetical protein
MTAWSVKFAIWGTPGRQPTAFAKTVRKSTPNARSAMVNLLTALSSASNAKTVMESISLQPSAYLAKVATSKTASSMQTSNKQILCVKKITI